MCYKYDGYDGEFVRHFNIPELTMAFAPYNVFRVRTDPTDALRPA